MKAGMKRYSKWGKWAFSKIPIKSGFREKDTERNPCTDRHIRKDTLCYFEFCASQSPRLLPVIFKNKLKASHSRSSMCQAQSTFSQLIPRAHLQERSTPTPPNLSTLQILAHLICIHVYEALRCTWVSDLPQGSPASRWWSQDWNPVWLLSLGSPPSHPWLAACPPNLRISLLQLCYLSWRMCSFLLSTC